jgi:hypothetical protein
MRTRTLKKDSYESPFIGLAAIPLLFGSKKKKTEAEVKKIEAESRAAAELEEQRRQKFLLELEAARQGYDPEKRAADSALKLEETKQSSEKTLYVIVGFIVVAVMAGLYFIKKR